MKTRLVWYVPDLGMFVRVVAADGDGRKRLRFVFHLRVYLDRIGQEFGYHAIKLENEHAKSAQEHDQPENTDTPMRAPPICGIPCA